MPCCSADTGKQDSGILYKVETRKCEQVFQHMSYGSGVCCPFKIPIFQHGCIKPWEHKQENQCDSNMRQSSLCWYENPYITP